MSEIQVVNNTFQHEPMDLTKPTIRVLQILPGTGMLRCCMRQAETKSKHAAVSYVWGSSESVEVILINDRPFCVRRNLYDFLIQMRKNNFLEPLWVDALCIDQSIISERNHQVQQMGSIYRDAQTVFSWLGQGDDSIIQFIQIAVAISKEVAEQKAARVGITRNTDTGRLFYLSVHRHRFEIAKFHQLVEKFCNIEYFDRTWIVQEVFLATGAHKAMYGDVGLDWADLKLVILICIKMAGTQLSTAPVLPFVQPLVPHANTANSSNIIALITKFAKTRCSDPRDRIFALRMLWDSRKFPIQVDYSLSRISLFVKLTSQLLTSSAQPMSNVVTFLDVLELQSDDIAKGVELCGAEDSRPITLSVAWSRDIDIGELFEYRVKRAKTGKYKFLERTAAHDFHFCTCEHCIQLDSLPESTVFREYILRSRDHDATTSIRMDQELYLVEITTSKTYFGIVEGDLQDSDIFLLITPACLNRASDPPRIEERDGKLAVSLSLRCLCELFGHFRPDEIEEREGSWYRSRRDGYWGIDCNKHDYIYDDSDPSSDQHSYRSDERVFWGRREWRRKMREQQLMSRR